MREKIKSPCIGKCNLNKETQMCDGCKRTASELLRWRSMNKQEKKEILSRLNRPECIIMVED